jgi:hypothetical protein
MIPTLADCVRIIEQCRVALRGWDFPHLSHERDEREFGDNYVASWAYFMDEIEYWRFYQSGQFLHLHAIQESVSAKWRKQLEADARGHLRHLHVDWSRIGGFISLMNFFYRIIEIVEFATRLCQKDVYRDHLSITIELKQIKNFLLTTDWRRSWSELRKCKQESLGHSWTVHSTQLIAGSSDHSLKIAKWFFERFGWLNPSDDILRREQQNFLEGRV